MKEFAQYINEIIMQAFNSLFHNMWLALIHDVKLAPFVVKKNMHTKGTLSWTMFYLALFRLAPLLRLGYLL